MSEVQEEPVKIVLSPVSIEGETFLKGSNIHIRLYKNCLTYDVRQNWEITTDNSEALLVHDDSRIGVDKYQIAGIYRRFDSAYGVFVLNIGDHFKVNIKNRKRADEIYNLIFAWRWGI